MSYDPLHRTELKKARFVSAYSPKLRVGLVCPDVSPYTDQSFRDEADINTIMARYQSTGEMPILNEMNPQFLDVDEGMDFQTHMDFILDAQDMFDQLPSRIRDRFGNNPGAFLEFSTSPDNRLELAKMGLLNDEATRSLLNPPAPEPDGS